MNSIQTPASGHQPEETVEVLRALWSGQGQSSADLEDCFGTQGSCKNTRSIGFDGMAGAEGDLPSAWRATLEREGKLSSDASSVADLVLGPAPSSTK